MHRQKQRQSLLHSTLSPHIIIRWRLGKEVDRQIFFCTISQGGHKIKNWRKKNGFYFPFSPLVCVDESIETNGRQGGWKEPHFAADLLQRSELLLFRRRQLALLLRDTLFLLLLDLFLSVLLLLSLLLFLLVFVLGILGVRVTGCGGGGVQLQGLAFSVGD